jgi:hypothetical protein
MNMGDVKPNYELEKMRVEIDRDAHLISIKRLNLRLLELDDEKKRVGESIEAAKKSLVEIEAKIELKGVSNNV